MSTANYTISTTLYDGAFSANQNYPDNSRSTLETQPVFTFTAYEHELSGYTLDPDIQRTNANGDTCDLKNVLYIPKNGIVGTEWVYIFNKAWLYDGVTTEINYEISLSPNNSWLTWTNNTTHLDFRGTVALNAHAVEYELTVVAKLRSDGSQVDKFTTNFTIKPNHPPTIRNMKNVFIYVPYGAFWGNGDDVIQEPEGDTLTITIVVDGLSITWISINTTNYDFRTG